MPHTAHHSLVCASRLLGSSTGAALAAGLLLLFVLCWGNLGSHTSGQLSWVGVEPNTQPTVPLLCSLLSCCRAHPELSRPGESFVALVTGLLERLLDYRAVMNDENKTYSMSCTVNLLVSACTTSPTPAGLQHPHAAGRGVWGAGLPSQLGGTAQPCAAQQPCAREGQVVVAARLRVGDGGGGRVSPLLGLPQCLILPRTSTRRSTARPCTSGERCLIEALSPSAHPDRARSTAQHGKVPASSRRVPSPELPPPHLL